MDMKQVIKKHLYSAVNAQQAVVSYLDLDDYGKAVRHAEEAIAEMTAVTVLLATALGDQLDRRHEPEQQRDPGPPEAA